MLTTVRCVDDDTTLFRYSAERASMLLAAIEQIKTATGDDDDDDDDGGGGGGGGSGGRDGEDGGSSDRAAAGAAAAAAAAAQSVLVQSLNVKIVNEMPEPENAYKYYHYIDELVRRKEVLRLWQEGDAASTDGAGAGAGAAGRGGAHDTLGRYETAEKHGASDAAAAAAAAAGSERNGNGNGGGGGGDGDGAGGTDVRTQAQWQAAIDACVNRSELLAIGKELKVRAVRF